MEGGEMGGVSDENAGTGHRKTLSTSARFAISEGTPERSLQEQYTL